MTNSKHIATIETDMGQSIEVSDDLQQALEQASGELAAAYDADRNRLATFRRIDGVWVRVSQ